MNERCVIVFTRFPREREGKTRLAQEVGNHIAALLNRAFLLDIFTRFKERDFDLLVAGASGDKEKEFAELINVHGSFDHFFLPDGATTDEQVRFAYQTALTRYKKVVLTASDIPQLTHRHIQQMFADLDEVDIVFHMNHDGGTCPQGMKVAYDLFTGSSERSIGHCREWKERIESLRLSHRLEPEILIDIDTLEDLVIFYHWQNLLGKESEMYCPITIQTVKEVLSL